MILDPTNNYLCRACLCLAALVWARTSPAQVSIGTPTPDQSAILDLSSTNQGFLLPRLSTTQRDAISTPAVGLMIYNTTKNGLELYHGSVAEINCLSGNSFSSVTVGNMYGMMSSGWSNDYRGMAQSFTSSGGLVHSISIDVATVQDSSKSNLYEMVLFAGQPSCGQSGGSSCSLSDFGTPLHSELFQVRSGVCEVQFSRPIGLAAGSIYTFAILPTAKQQAFNWSGYTTGYSSGSSNGINGNISGISDDFKFKVTYREGWRLVP